MSNNDEWLYDLFKTFMRFTLNLSLLLIHGIVFAVSYILNRRQLRPPSASGDLLDPPSKRK